MTESPIAAAAAAALAAKREAEAAAAAAARGALIASARERLSGDAWAGLDAAALDVALVDTRAELVVLTDGAVHLGVLPGAVHLVTNDDGWTRGAVVDSLAAVGVALGLDVEGEG